MSSTEDTAAATGAAAAAASTTGGMHYMYAEAVEQYEANVAAASMGGTDEGGQASGKPSNSAATTGGDDKPKKSKPRGHLPWKLAKELPSPEGEANPWNRTGGGQPVSQLANCQTLILGDDAREFKACKELSRNCLSHLF